MLKRTGGKDICDADTMAKLWPISRDIDHAPRARPEFDEMRRRLNEPTGARTFQALAVQQPSPSLEWRTDLTVLTDFRGGWLVQPGGSGIRADRCSSMPMPTSCAAIASMTILPRASGRPRRSSCARRIFSDVCVGATRNGAGR